MAYQPKSYRKFVATAATATLVATAVTPAFAAETNFTDATGQYKEAINYVVEKEIAKGISKDKFGTFNPITRGDAAVMIAKAIGLDTTKAPDSGFKDLNSRVKGAVDALFEKKIISGKSKTEFKPNDKITRQEMAKILVNAYDLKSTGEKNEFKDVNSNFAQYVDALVSNGITKGIDSKTFGSLQDVTRGQFAIFVHRADHPAPKVEVSAVKVADDKTLEVTLKEAKEGLKAEDFKVAIDGAAVKASKVEADEKGSVYKLTIDSLNNKAGKVTVNGAEASFDFTAAKVTSVMAINATQVEVKFTKAVDKTDAEAAGKVTVQGVNFNKQELSEDGKTLKLTADAAIDVKNAAVIVEPIKTKADSAVKTQKFVSTITFKDEVAPAIVSVEAKTNEKVAKEITVKASEPIKTGALVKVNGSYANIDFAGTDTAKVSGLSLEAGKTHTIELINAEDLAGNKTVSATATFSVGVDTAAPTATLTAQGDNKILVTFNKKMDVDTVKAGLANGSVKDEALEAVATDAVTEVTDSKGTQFEIPVASSVDLYKNKDSRTLNVVFKNTIKDALGNKLEETTQKVSLTKDTVKPVATGYNVVKDADGKVTAIEVNFSEELAVASNISFGSVVDENGVLDTTTFNGVKGEVTAKDNKKVVYKVDPAKKINGKFAVTFEKELVSDTAQKANKSDAFNYTIDFGQAESAKEFEVTSATAANNVVTVKFPEAVKGGAVANSATDPANYSLAGKPLPAGTTITLNGNQTEATITLPKENSVEKDDKAAVFTVANIKNTAGTKTVKTYSGTVPVKDNVKPVLESAKILDNKTIELTYNEAINLTGTDVGADFTIMEGTEALKLNTNELKASAVPGFDKKVKIEIAQGGAAGTEGTAEVNTLTVANDATKAGNIEVTFNDGGGTPVVKTVAVADTDTKEKVAENIAKAFSSLPGYTVAAANDKVTFTASAAAADKDVTVSVADADATGVGTLASTETTKGVAPIAPIPATTLDLNKDITVETKASTVIADTSKNADGTPAGNTQKEKVKVTVSK